MDAKPQRIRVRGDENVPPSLATSKGAHQRNKSTSALNVTALGAKNGPRRAFGDVSNVKTARDDSAVGAKPAIQVDCKPSLSQPAQRPMSMSGIKGLLNNVTSKPVNPAGKAAPATKGNKRNNAVFRDNLKPVVEREPSKEVVIKETVQHDARGAAEAFVPVEAGEMKSKESSIVMDEKKAVDVCVRDTIDVSLPGAESDTTLSDIDDTKDPRGASALRTSEPEEYWEDDAENSLPFDNTTGGTTAVIFPRVNAVSQRQLAYAKKIVESTITEEELMEDFYDTSMVAEYSHEIFTYLGVKEMAMLPVPDYMANQAEIQWSMRAVLMDWLVQVHFRFSLLPETLFLCVNCIDRFLSNKVVSLGKLQLVGATALFIAAKYEEINAPSVHEIVYMVDGGYSVEEILKAERFMLTILGFDLGWPGPMSFLRRISKADDYELKLRTLAKYFLEVTIMDERFVSTPSSYLAAGAHCLAIQVTNDDKWVWSMQHAYYAGYMYRDLVPVMLVMLECCEDPRSHHAAVFEKYCCEKRFKASALTVETAMRAGFRLRAPLPLNHPYRLDGRGNF